MKNLIVAPLFMLVIVGCASDGKQVAGTKGPSDIRMGEEFTTMVAPKSVRTSENRRTDCPHSISAIKGKNWRQQVVAGGGCVYGGQWKMVEAIGVEMSKSHHLVKLRKPK